MTPCIIRNQCELLILGLESALLVEVQRLGIGDECRDFVLLRDER
jgi:hypothetical protein